MNNLKFIDGTPVDANYAASIEAINNILANCEEEIGIDVLETYAASQQIEEIKSQKITFYFGDQVVGEVKFIKAGTKADKIDRCKKQLIKKENEMNPGSLIGQMLYSPFCNFKIF